MINTKHINILFLLISSFSIASATASFDDAILIQGNAIQGGMLIGTAPADAKVSVAGRDLTLTEQGHFVFGLDRDNPSEETITVILANSQKLQKTLTIKKRDYRIQHVNGVAKKFVQKKPETVLKRIRKEVRAVKAARNQHIERTDFLQPFKWPLVGPITGVFGSQRVYNGKPGRPHYGVDIAAPMGTDVIAPLGGVVTLAYDDMYYSGGTLIIDHGYGISSTFLHLSELLVEVGQVVEQDQVIAKVGTGGRSTGPHLDWRMNWYKRRIDPQLLVPKMPIADK